MGLVWLMKCFRNSRKSSSCIQPLPFAVPIDPSGPPAMKCGRNLLRGKTKWGGMMFPRALPASAMVTRVPLSPEVTAPTLLTPLEATMKPGFWTVTSPVSSMFHTSLACRKCLVYTLASFLKNESTLILLKFEFRCKLVA